MYYDSTYMGNAKTKKIMKIVFVLALIASGYFIKSNRDHIRGILEDCNYTIGTVKTFFEAKPVMWGTGGRGQSVRFRYTVGGVEFEGTRSLRLPHEGIEKGDRFIVAYSNKNAENSVMLFDHPIREDSDFEKWLEEFKTNPPRLRTRRNHLPVNSAQIEE